MRSIPHKLAVAGAALGAWLLMSGPAISEDQHAERVLFEFTDGETESPWRAVNDGVMGGLSRGQPTLKGAKGILEFSGTLSLENNGGFSSIRSGGPVLDLGQFDGLAVRLRGDGRKYSFTLHTDYRIMAGSYRKDLSPVGEEWETVHLPFDQFYASSFGRRLSKAPPVNRKAVRSLGFILADKKAGPFKLEVDWIKAYREAHEGSDIVETAVGNGSFKTLAAALEAADLVGALKGKGPFTVFAPTDEAFAKLPGGTVENLLKPENRESLAGILTYHVVPGRLTSDEVTKLTGAKTLNGQRVEFRVEGGNVRVGEAKVTLADVGASNGVIHVIDSVLLPPSVASGSPESPAAKGRRLIEIAVRRGAPMYNAGNKAACAAIYEVAAHGLMAMSSDLLGRQERQRMESVLGRLEHDQDMDRRAWSLRHMLDDIHRSLRGR